MKKELEKQREIQAERNTGEEYMDTDRDEER
jgi:hypothetical protein